MDYELHLKVKNARLMRAIRADGCETIGSFCRKHDLRATDIGKYCNLQKPALNKHGRLHLGAERLCFILGVLPEDIFPPEMMEGSIKKNSAIMTISAGQARMLSGGGDSVANTDLLEELSNSDFTDKLLATLTSRENRILRLRFFEDKTLDEVADVFDVTRERVRQIEAKAMRKLRHSKNDVMSNLAESSERKYLSFEDTV